MVKVSVIMPVYNVEKFIKKSVNSILNQTLRDIELICVDDGSDDNSLAILHEFSDNDSRVKVFSLNHEGAGNARNFALKYATGEYIYYMDSDDMLYLNAFEDFYLLSKTKNLDLLIFKAINYDVKKDYFYETDYYNMVKISDFAKRNVFSFEDLGNLIFDVCETPWCKFYNGDLVRNSNAIFRENSKFNDNQFHWGILFNSKRIYFLDECYYTRTRHSESLTGSKDKSHMDIIGVSNDIIDLFESYNQLNKYKKILYNRKINWILLRYNEIKVEYQGLFFDKIKEDFINNENTEFRDILWDKFKFIFDSAIVSRDHNDFNYMLKYYDIINDKNLTGDDKCLEIKNWFDSLKTEFKSYIFNNLKEEVKKIDKSILSSSNINFYDTLVTSENFEEYDSNLINNHYSNKSNSNDVQYLKGIISKNDELISKLYEEVEELKLICSEKDELISKLYEEVEELKLICSEKLS